MPDRKVLAVTPALLSRRLRWLAPAVAAGLVAAGVAVPRLADAAPGVDDLPPRTPAQLLAAVSTAEVEGLSGTVVATSRLGLPELPDGRDTGSALSLTDLLAGSTTARVWKAGDDRSRVAVDAPFAEYDVVRRDREVWTYDSASKDVTHLTLPAPDDEPAPRPSRLADPQEAADALLAMVTDSTSVSVGRSAVVAGRAAYELVLDPRDAGTLVDTVRIAVDGRTGVPLRVQVHGVGQREAALEVAFTEVRFDVPDDAVFRFVPPPGTQVTERTLPRHDDGAHERRPRTTTSPAAGPRGTGEGWTRVVELRGAALPEQAAGTFAALSRPVDGGRAVRSALLSVLLTDDGRVLAGAVPVEELVRRAGR